MSRPARTRQIQARRRLGGWLLALAASALPWTPLPAAEQGGATLERNVKAAFLYKFLGYAEFPPSAFSDAGAPVVIGVAGADEMAAELTRIVAGRAINGRPVLVKTLRENEVAAGVHLLFVGGAENARVLRVLKAAQPSPLLVVTENENGLQLGSVINFKIIDDRVRFDVSLEAADKNNVKLSSRLLTVANHVVKAVP